MIAVDATIEDIPHMLIMGKAMICESRYRDLSYNHSKLAKTLTFLIGHERGIVLKTPNGMLIGCVEEYWFGNDLYANEAILYVTPEARGLGEAVRLVKAYIERAKALGAKEIHIENTTEVDTERTERFFERMGFRRVGGNYLMENNHV